MKDHSHFDYMEDNMKSYGHWYDQPDTFGGKLVKVYNIFRIALSLLLLVVAISQVYYYGKSYVVHDSAVFVPLGIIGVIGNSYLARNIGSVQRTALQFKFHLSSFVVDWEKQSIDTRMEDTKQLVSRMIFVIKYYIVLVSIVHCTSMSMHYFFGLFSKPILIPVLLEMFLDGNYELRPMLFAVVISSIVYVQLISSVITVLGLTVHFLGAVAGSLDVLIKRLEDFSGKPAKGCEKLAEDSDLSDTIQKHAELLKIFNEMKEWNGFPVSFILTMCSISLCLNAITAKQSLGNKEYSSFVIWGTFLLVVLALTYIMCSRGQEIEIKSENLVRAMYDLPWYRESYKSRRAVALMLVQGNRLITLEYKGLMRLNLVTYSEMLKTSYSYFMLLNSVE